MRPRVTRAPSDSRCPHVALPRRGRRVSYVLSAGGGRVGETQCPPVREAPASQSSFPGLGRTGRLKLACSPDGGRGEGPARAHVQCQRELLPASAVWVPPRGRAPELQPPTKAPDAGPCCRQPLAEPGPCQLTLRKSSCPSEDGATARPMGRPRTRVHQGTNSAGHLGGLNTPSALLV